MPRSARSPFATLTGVAALTTLAGSAISCGDVKVYPYVHQSGGKVTCPDMMVGYAAVLTGSWLGRPRYKRPSRA